MVKLKISKKMQTLICAIIAPVVAQSIAAEIASERIDKAGAVNITASEADVALLRDQANTRLAALEVALKAATTDDERKPHFGENSAWRALERQLPPLTAS